MTTRNLDALFDPRAIALIGASRRPSSIDGVGALAGAFAVYEAAFRRAGLLQVDDIGDLSAPGRPSRQDRRRPASA